MSCNLADPGLTTNALPFFFMTVTSMERLRNTISLALRGTTPGDMRSPPQRPFVAQHSALMAELLANHQRLYLCLPRVDSWNDVTTATLSALLLVFEIDLVNCELERKTDPASRSLSAYLDPTESGDDVVTLFGMLDTSDRWRATIRRHEPGPAGGRTSYVLRSGATLACDCTARVIVGCREYTDLVVLNDGDKPTPTGITETIDPRPSTPRMGFPFPRWSGTLCLLALAFWLGVLWAWRFPSH